MTRRGFKEQDFKDLGLLIAKFIKSMAANSLALDVETENFVKAEVRRLTEGLNFYKSEVKLSQKFQ
jgi:glycine/serine hydroxymethyltransferase